MLESDEQIALALSMGETLTFTGFTLKGFVSTNVYNLQSYDSPYDLEKIDFYVRLATSDFISKSLTAGVQFNVIVHSLTFNFSIMNFTHDMTGWTKMDLNCLSVTHS